MILTDLKTDLSITGTAQDQYLLDYCINPAVARATALSLNIKTTTVTLTSSVASYDLTSALVASPVVASSGVQELFYDPEYPWVYSYKKDFIIYNKTTLRFVSSDIPLSGTMRLKYNEYFSNATNVTETNAPSALHPYIKDWALAEYGLNRLAIGSTGITEGSVEEKQEENLRVKFGSGSSRQDALNALKKSAEKQILELGASAGLNFYGYRVV